ncbi:unnamed protein product [Linum trigynum]|uniref:Uncharacterized protein n=1 Tax=Linum trigynum TaxID=586398 RepID=A0AAV2EEC1_9ROSI
MKPSAVDGKPKTNGDENLRLQEAHTKVPEASIMDKSDFESFTRERNDIIVPNFAKELKQYKEKLLVAEMEVESVGESLRNERSRRFELEKELEDLKLRCTCSKEQTVEATLRKVDGLFQTERVSESRPCDSPKIARSFSEQICSVLEPKPCDSPKITESISKQICSVPEPMPRDSSKSTESISEQIQQDTEQLAPMNAANCSQSSSIHQESGINEVHDQEATEDQMASTSGDLRDEKAECLDLELDLVKAQPAVVQRKLRTYQLLLQ